MAELPFHPALLIVDFQQDFCPPNGSLPVPQARTIAPAINTLLTLPFALKIATKDWHPPTHISFAPNHTDPKTNQPLRPFLDAIPIPNPNNTAQTQLTRLWPPHCVQNTPGAELVPELHVERLDRVVEKGRDEKVEMYSVFYDNFRVEDSGLAGELRAAGVTDVFVVGLAADYCVKCSAVHAAEEGFRTYVVEEATKAVDPASGWREELEGAGARVVGMEGPELARVKALAKEG